jgi:hypothetical protein
MKRPLAIMVWSVIWLATFVWGALIAFSAVRLDMTHWISWALLAGLTALHLAMTYALWKMSRWPVVVYFLSTTYNLVSGFFKTPSWHERYPILGPFVLIFWMGAFAVSVLPHWKNMTWSPLGRHDFGSPKGAH